MTDMLVVTCEGTQNFNYLKFGLLLFVSNQTESCLNQQKSTSN